MSLLNRQTDLHSGGNPLGGLVLGLVLVLHMMYAHGEGKDSLAFYSRVVMQTRGRGRGQEF